MVLTGVRVGNPVLVVSLEIGPDARFRVELQMWLFLAFSLTQVGPIDVPMLGRVATESHCDIWDYNSINESAKK